MKIERRLKEVRALNEEVDSLAILTRRLVQLSEPYKVRYRRWKAGVLNETAQAAVEAVRTE